MNPYLLNLADWRHDVATGAYPTEQLARRGAVLIELAAHWELEHPLSVGVLANEFRILANAFRIMFDACTSTLGHALTVERAA